MPSDAVPAGSHDCPTLEKLQAFCRGRLVAAEINSISQHLQSCGRCASLMVDLSQEISAEGTDATRETAASAKEDGASHGTVTYHSATGLPQRIGPYLVLRVLGRGGFGSVLLARDIELDRLVAIKVPRLERLQTSASLDDYHHEAKLHAGIDHPHVVPIYHVGRTAEAPFFVVSKFIPGMDLTERLRRGGLDHRTIARWVATLADALEHIHRQGLIHRDVKARNVMIDAAGTAYLMDFGLAKAAGGEALTSIVGTPGYMSPEQARGAADVDGRTDIYALGVLLYELLTGQRPFQGNATAIFNQLAAIEPPSPRQLVAQTPRDLEAICLKAMAKDPARRYQRAAELSEDLRRWLAGEPLRLARRVGLMERAWSWTRRHRAVASLAGIAVAAVALSGLAWLRPREPVLPTFKATLQTEPPGADVHYFPLDIKTGLFDPKRGKTAVAGALVDLTPGYHLVVAVLPDGRFHEVFRYVPADLGELHDPHWHNKFRVTDGVVHVQPLKIPEADPAEGMALVPGTDSFAVGPVDHPAAPTHRRRLPSFYLDTHEVTVAAYTKRNPQFLFPDGAPVPPPNFPMTYISWDRAVMYAEALGKRLPDEIEYEYVATELGRRRQRPKELPASPSIAPSGQPELDRIEIEGQPTIFGMRSNVAEWTGSWVCDFPSQKGMASFDPMKRVVRGAIGAAPEAAKDGDSGWQPYHREFVARPVARMGIGFRCARSVRPRITPEQFGGIIP